MSEFLKFCKEVFVKIEHTDAGFQHVAEVTEFPGAIATVIYMFRRSRGLVVLDTVGCVFAARIPQEH